MGTATTEQGSLNAMGITGSWEGRGQGAELKHQIQGGQGYHNGQQGENSYQNSLTQRPMYGIH